MKYSYYPGCTLRTKAKDLDAYARASAKVLGFELEEIENWQCCGGVYPLGTDEIATKLSSVRALNEAKEKGQDLVTLCSACHHVIKRVNDDMKNVEDIRTRANNYMQLEEPYAGETTVLHFLEVLRDRVGFDTLKEKEIGELLMILVETSLVRIAIQCISLTVTLIVYGRMFEIYVYSSVSSIPFATKRNKQSGQIGTNYIKGLFALGLQGLFLMICLGIYTVLIRTVQITDIHASLFSILGYALLLGLMMFKSGTVAKSIMNTH